VNPYLQSLLLGIVEGLTEFLPVSSTAHLRISQALLNIDLDSGYWKMYSIVIQLGAILCLPIYFRRRIWKFLSTFPAGERGDRTVFTHPLTLVAAAFVVTALPAWRLHKLIGKNLESLTVMGSALLIGGVVMWIVDRLFGWTTKAAVGVPGSEVVAIAAGQPDVPQPLPVNDAPAKEHPLLATTERIEDMKWWQAIWIGAVQILSAVFPGTSRSMCTIAAGQVTGMSRPSALEFSFLLSIPTMIVATGYEFLKTIVLKKGDDPGETLPPIEMDSQKWIILAIGFAVSFVVAWAVVAWFMAWVRRRGFAPFAIYRIILGIAVLAWVFRHPQG